MAVKMAPTTIKIEAMTTKMMLQLAEIKVPPMVIPGPLPSSLDSILSLSMTDSGRLESERRLEYDMAELMDLA